MQDYYITYSISWKLTIKVKSETEEEAYKLAEEEFNDADLNEMVIDHAYARD